MAESEEQRRVLQAYWKQQSEEAQREDQLALEQKLDGFSLISFLSRSKGRGKRRPRIKEVRLVRDNLTNEAFSVGVDKVATHRRVRLR